MARKRPCRICRRWFRPDPRVGGRQRTCSRPECQRERRVRTQASWRARNPEYYHHRRLTLRSAAAEAAEQALAVRGGGKAPTAAVVRPAPLAMPACLQRVPWDLLQDEITVQVTDAIGVTAREIMRAVKDQKRVELIDSRGAMRRLRRGSMQDQIGGAPP
jgi:hypothetical protein